MESQAAMSSSQFPLDVDALISSVGIVGAVEFIIDKTRFLNLEEERGHELEHERQLSSLVEASNNRIVEIEFLLFDQLSNRNGREHLVP